MDEEWITDAAVIRFLDAKEKLQGKEARERTKIKKLKSGLYDLTLPCKDGEYKTIVGPDMLNQMTIDMINTLGA